MPTIEIVGKEKILRHCRASIFDLRRFARLADGAKSANRIQDVFTCPLPSFAQVQHQIAPGGGQAKGEPFCLFGARNSGRCDAVQSSPDSRTAEGRV